MKMCLTSNISTEYLQWFDSISLVSRMIFVLILFSILWLFVEQLQMFVPRAGLVCTSDGETNQKTSILLNTLHWSSSSPLTFWVGLEQHSRLPSLWLENVEIIYLLKTPGVPFSCNSSFFFLPKQLQLQPIKDCLSHLQLQISFKEKNV